MINNSLIHPTAIIDNSAEIASDVVIGPYCIIGSQTKIDSGTILKSHVVIDGNTIIGKNNIIYPFATIGLAPQDLKFKGENSQVIIGNNNIIREHVTIHLGTKEDKMLTEIGDNCLFMVGSHIAHDCKISNNVILANNATLAGHVIIEDYVIIGGLSAIKQFTRIGKNAMIGGMSGIEKDVIPYGLVKGERACLVGLNLVGLKRKNIDRKQIIILQNFFAQLFDKNQKSLTLFDRLKNINHDFANTLAEDIITFIISKESKNSLCQPKYFD
jgi:UDP-N-acetylglucosamine acyltransferase